MKNFTISIEGLLLLLLLLIGLYGAHTIMKGEEASPGFASPRQEAPAMVLVPDQTSDVYSLDDE